MGFTMRLPRHSVPRMNSYMRSPRRFAPRDDIFFNASTLVESVIRISYQIDHSSHLFQWILNSRSNLIPVFDPESLDIFHTLFFIDKSRIKESVFYHAREMRDVGFI